MTKCLFIRQSFYSVVSAVNCYRSFKRLFTVVCCGDCVVHCDNKIIVSCFTTTPLYRPLIPDNLD